MPKVNRTADVRQSVKRHGQRVHDLERTTNKPGRSKLEELVPISSSGIVEVQVSSPYPLRRGGQLVAVLLYVPIGAEPTDDSTFQVRINNVAVGNVITLAAGEASVNEYVGNVRGVAGDGVSLEVLTAAADLADLGGHMVFKG